MVALFFVMRKKGRSLQAALYYCKLWVSRPFAVRP